MNNGGKKIPFNFGVDPDKLRILNQGGCLGLCRDVPSTYSHSTCFTSVLSFFKMTVANSQLLYRDESTFGACSKWHISKVQEMFLCENPLDEVF